MDDRKEALKRSLDYFLPWLVLAILLAYTYARFFQNFYGIWWLPDGTITETFVGEREPTLHPGDRIVRVGPLDFTAFQADLRTDLFGSAPAGTVLPITIQRAEQTVTVQWRVPGINTGEIQDRLLSQWFLAYFFWIFGTLTLLVVRPRDARWLLLTAFNYLTAIWLIPGGLSSFHIWSSALVVRAAIWLSIPVYLHFHWVFPSPLGRLSPGTVWSAYAVAVVLVIAQWLQLVPASLYNFGFLLAVAGSLFLLIIHYLQRPDLRRDLGLLLLAALLAIIPSISLGILRLLAPVTPTTALLAFLSFPILPAAYLYAAYRKQLGDLELRVNRLLSLYIFLIMLGAIIVPLLVITARLPVYSSDQTFIIGVGASVFATAFSLSVFPVFQRLVERRLLGIVVPSRELQQTYSDHITGSTSFTELTRLLQDEVMPSLLVRQFVFLAFDQGTTAVLLSMGLGQEQIPIQDARVRLASWIRQPHMHPSLDDPHLAWIRLVIPLRVQDDLLGLWLFGRRDPDDTYSTIEVPILQSFANETAIALSNILQTERLRALYQADITRHENERLSLARDLHDSVLSELAGMLMNTDMQSLPKNFQDGYQALTQRLREIVSDLRPPMLNYGLRPAFEELADNLMERSKDAVQVLVDMSSDDDRYPPDVEQHVFRIVQEACENALRHSQGQSIRIGGQLAKARIDLAIEDDGQGFELRKQKVQLYDLLSERHFGLAGMLERAELIGAEIRIASIPGDGTLIQVHWQPRAAALHAQPSGEFSS